MKKTNGPRILLIDIETSTLTVTTWGIRDQYINVPQIKTDWHLLSYAAKWLNEPKMFYRDQRGLKKVSDDRQLLKDLWKLLDECDILVTQNGVSFDHRKINARFAIHGMTPPSPFRHIDTFRMGRKHFAFTSHKLEYMTGILNKKYKKLKHSKYPGQELWDEVMKDNLDAWKVMEKYNKYDVLSLEELYLTIRAWDTSIDINTYRADNDIMCNCGSKEFHKRGFFHTNTGKYQRYTCTKCGAHTRSKTNLLTKDKKTSLKRAAT